MRSSALICICAAILAVSSCKPKPETASGPTDVMAAHWTINRAAAIAPQLVSAGLISEEESTQVLDTCLAAKDALDELAEDLLSGDLSDAARQINTASTQVRSLEAFLDANEIKMPQPSPTALRRVGRVYRDS